MEARITRIPPNAIDGAWTLERREARDQPWILDTKGEETGQDADALRQLASDRGWVLIADEEDTPVETPTDDYEDPI